MSVKQGILPFKVKVVRGMLGLVLSGVALTSPVRAQVYEISSRQNIHFAAKPGFLPSPGGASTAGNPYYLFAMSRDQQLFYKAYSDYTDFNKDNIPEIGYQHEQDYYGYFDPYKCYTYRSSEVFEPRAFSPYSSNRYTKYCDDVDGEWSGNFLNWATMSRIDVVRKAIYGGKRSTDSTAETILEAATIPQDSHAFVKYYNGDDIAGLSAYGEGSEITLCRLTLVNTGRGTLLASSQSTEAPPPAARGRR